MRRGGRATNPHESARMPIIRQIPGTVNLEPGTQSTQPQTCPPELQRRRMNRDAEGGRGSGRAGRQQPSRPPSGAEREEEKGTTDAHGWTQMGRGEFLRRLRRWTQIPSIQYPASSIQYPASSIQTGNRRTCPPKPRRRRMNADGLRLAACGLRLAACSLSLEASIQHPVSSIQHPGLNRR